MLMNQNQIEDFFLKGEPIDSWDWLVQSQWLCLGGFKAPHHTYACWILGPWLASKHALILKPWFLPSILYFMECILKNTTLEPMFLTSIPDKKSAAKACCWSAARGHTSPCASGRNTEVCPPAGSLQPAVTTWIIEHQFRLLADDAPPYTYNLQARGRSNKTPRNTNPSQRISWLCHTSNTHSMQPAISPAKSPPKSRYPSPKTQQSVVFAMYCSVPLSVSTAASAGSELLTLWTPSHTHLHAHTQTPESAHRTHKNAITVRESGFGVTFHCLSGSGPRPRRLAPPLVLPDFPTLSLPFYSCSHPSTLVPVSNQRSWLNCSSQNPNRLI